MRKSTLIGLGMLTLASFPGVAQAQSKETALTTQRDWRTAFCEIR